MKERRNLILTLAGMGVSGLGTDLYAFAISFYILKITGSATNFALSLVLSTLPAVILNPIVGNLVDRLNKKMLVVAADMLSGLLMFGLFFLTMGNELSLIMIYTTTFFLSIFNVFLGTSFTAAFGSIVTEKYITKLNSFQQTIMALIQMGSPIFGGMIYALVDIRLFILINGVSFIISGCTELLIDFKLNSTLVPGEGAKNSFLENFVEGFRYVKSNKMYVSLAVYALVINFFLSAFSVIVPYTLVTLHAFDSGLVGIVQATFPVGMLVASIVIGSKNIQFSKKLFSRVIMLFSVSLVLFTIPSLPFVNLGSLTPIYYGIVFMMIAANAVSVNVPLGVKLQTSVDEAYRGRFFGFLGMMSEGVMPISYLLCGFLIGFVPTYVILYVSAAALIIITIHIKGNKTLDGSVNKEKVMESVQVSA